MRIIAKHLVAGRWEESVGPLGLHPSPVHGCSGTHYGDATPDQIDRALTAAQNAQLGWSALPPAARASNLERAAGHLESALDEIAREMSREVGKTLRESAGEIENAIKLLRYFGGAALRPDGQRYPTARARTLTVSARSPLGVVLAISPWNFPVNLTVLKLAPALAAGNAVVVKPSPMAAKTSELLIRAIAPQFPSGLITLLHGDGAVGGALVAASTVAGVTFTGSTAVGTAIGRRVGARGIPYLAEMGGKNVLYIDRGANIAAAVDAALTGAFSMAGQKCTATGLLLVHADIAAEVTAQIRHRVIDSPFAAVGDPFSDATTVGPMVSDDAAQRVADIVADARRHGAELIRFTANPDQDYRAPHVAPVALVNVGDNSRAYREEVFGPVLPIFPVVDLGEAVGRLNSLGYGLVSSIYTDNLETALTFSSRVQTGTVLVNQPTTGLDHNVPFVGWGDSGIGGVEQSDSALDFYTRTQTTYLSW